MTEVSILLTSEGFFPIIIFLVFHRKRSFNFFKEAFQFSISVATSENWFLHQKKKPTQNHINKILKNT